MSKGKDNANPSETGTPKAAVGRLSLYLRQLEVSFQEGKETISSNQLGKALAVTDAQVRKDLAYFGQFGYPGIGYRVAELRDALRSVLGTDKIWRVALVGMGNLGRALLGHKGFSERGFLIEAIFDADARLIGQTMAGMAIQPIENIAEAAAEKDLKLAVLTVPAEAAQKVAERIVSAGIVGILNFAPVALKVPPEVSVISVDLGLQLEQLVFQVTQRDNAEESVT